MRNLLAAALLATALLGGALPARAEGNPPSGSSPSPTWPQDEHSRTSLASRTAGANFDMSRQGA